MAEVYYSEWEGINHSLTIKENALEKCKVGNESWVESNGHWEITVCFRRLLSSPFQHICLAIHFNLSAAFDGRRTRKKNGWTMIERELQNGYFSSPFHLKSRLVCSSASWGIEDPWHQQTQIWLKCSNCWLRTSEWHLLSAQRFLLETSRLERTERVVTLTTPLTFGLSGVGWVTHRQGVFCSVTHPPYIEKLLLRCWREELSIFLRVTFRVANFSRGKEVSLLVIFRKISSFLISHMALEI